MKYQAVIDQLTQQYQIIGRVDLREFDQQQEKRLFSRLDQLCRPQYLEQQRIVVVADNALHRTIEDHVPDIMIELQQHISYYNIPHYFVIVVSNIKTIEQDLLYLKNRYYPQEERPMGHIYVDC